jgi:lipopolysaccharide heptosyltransferase I
MSDPGPRVLIILMGALGDVVRGLCLVDAIRAAWPNCRVTWLVEPACAGLVKLHPKIDRVVVFDRKSGLRGVLAVRKELQAEAYDVTLDLQRHFKSGVFSRFSRAPRRIGFNSRDAKELNSLFNTEQVTAHGEQISKVEHYLKFLAPLGIATPERLTTGLEAITLERVTTPWKGLLSERYVGLVLGSSWDSKDWPEEGYQGLLKQLASTGIRVATLIGDKSRVEMAARLESGAPESVKIVNLAGKTSLEELVAVLRGAAVVVGPDSGPAHICGAIGTKHVTLFGPTPAVRNAPRGSEHLAITSAVGCSPCKRRVCPGLGKVCMRLISPEAVLARIAEV